MSRSHTTALIVALVVPGVAAGEASAATITVDRQCVNSKQGFGVSGGGFVPGSILDVQPENWISKRVVVGPAGTFAATLSAPGVDPFDPRPARPLAVLATDVTTRQQVASTTILTTYPKMLLLPRVVDARRRMTVSVRGLQPGIPAYAHVRVRGKWVRTLALGTPQAPCGTLRTKVPLLRKVQVRSLGFAYVQVDQRATPSIIQRPAGYARVLLRRPVGYAFYRYLAQVLRRGFHDATVLAPAAA